MQLSAYPYRAPKVGNSIEEYEDAHWPIDPVIDTCELRRFAVADGATETSYSGVWARLLVEAYCKGELLDLALSESVATLQDRWKESVGAQPLPWYAEEKVRSGAFSSLVGLTVEEPKTSNVGFWQAMAIGDSCLFQVRDDALITRFPLLFSEQFNNRPTLLSTNSSSNNLLDQVRRLSGDWEAGDVFYLMTDALACCFLKSVEDGDKPWKIKRATPEQFETWIEKLRQDGALRNDDVTMFRIETLLEQKSQEEISS